MTTPAGWYDDGSGNRRWWDGVQWTEHVVTGQPAPGNESTAAEKMTAETTAETTVSEATPVPEAPVATNEPEAPIAPFAPVAPVAAATAPVNAEPAPFAPPYTLPGHMPSAPAAAAYPDGAAAYPPHTGYPTASWPVAPSPQPAGGVPVVGIFGLGAVIVGVVSACIPAIAIAGWVLIAVGFAMSLISLFLRGRKWPGITGLAVAVVGAILAAAVSFLVLATTSSSSGNEGVPFAIPSESPSDGGTTAEGQDPSSIEGAEMVPFSDLEVGDCLPLVEYGEDELVYELPVVPCEQPHTDEVFFIYDVEDGEFPGDDALTETSWNGCYEAFEAYVGTSYEASELDFYNYQPTKGTWIREKDRTVQCILFSYEDVTGTLRDSGR
jgi:hypothetical protein